MSLENEGTDNPPRSATISSSLTKKRKIRGGFRAHSTKLSTDAKVLLSQDEPDILKTEHLSLSLKEKVKTLQHIDDEIFNLISDDDVEAEVINCEELRSEIQSLIVKLDAKTEALKSKARNQASLNFSQPNPSSSGLGVVSTQNTTKLPKLQLPKYEGDPRNWQEWWDAFEIIHNSTTLASVDKFRHLKTLLEGPAAKAISGIQMTNSNYEEAVDILKKRFSQKQIIINAHMEALLSLQRVSSERDIRSLRKLYDAIEVNVRSLKTLGIDFKQYGALLIPVIMNKVPDEIRLIITKEIKGEDWELDGILEILQGELEAREQSNQLQMKQSNGNFTKHAQGHHHFTTSALVAEGRKITCSYCNGSHYSAKCEIVSNPQARKVILRKQGRCFVCLRKNHLSKDCRSNVRCYDCKGRHHSSICDQHAHAGFTNPLQWQHPPGAQGSNLVKINPHDGVTPRSLESIGIHLEKENSVYQQFEEEIRFTDGRYEVKLPWKPDHPVLPDNYFLSKKRLQGLLTKLKQNSELFKEYDSIIKTQEEMGIIERVSDEECTVGRTHYLPHHAVVRQDKATTKVRVVYDASAKIHQGVSLNNCLYEGPCLLKTVAEILVRFRMYPIALTSDIEKAFLMISIHNSDRDALRFLWYEDIDKSELELVTYRFCRVVFGVSCSPFLLNATLKKHVEGYTSKHGEVCNKILNSLYADDINTGAHTVEETIELYRKAKQIMKEGGFNLRKWRSNSDKVVKEIMNNSADVNKVMRESPLLEEEDETYAKVTTKKLSTAACEDKILGIPWKSDTDELILKLSHLKQITVNQPITKRTILKTIASIFDPLGLISPVTTPLKVYMQGLFQQKLGWDEPLSNILQEEWISMVNELERVEEICLPRYYFDGIKEKAAKIQLIGFCDSSEKAYAASVYARVTVNDETSVKLVMSKSRVAPLSRLSIPRLELLSCLILARVIVAVKEMINAVLDVDIVHCYTDSISALYWIKGLNKEWKIFVENRVQEIRKLIKPELWSHCPGKENPADIPTRKSNISKLANRSEWWYGPEWLRYKDLPCFDRLKEVDVPQDCLNELRIHSSPETSTLISTVDDVPNIQEIITMDRFSDYGRILRVAAYVLRFIENCRNKDSRKSNELTAAEISKAERIFIVQAQSSFEGQYLGKLEKQLGVFKDKDGLLRCKGRLNNSSLDIKTRNPILIPRNHILANLIVKQSHENVLHNGVKETLMDLRSRFWIVKGRQLVKKIVHACKLCTRIQGLSYGHPEISQLPEFRVKEDLAFTSVGIDFAGPLFIKTESQALKKVYIALFTCATTRALHLEIVPNLSCEAFLLCLKRFVSRRGVPNLIVTDNAKTFKAASKRLTNIFKSAAVNHYLVRHNIKWKYNLAKAPWWGGFYERLIKGVKLCLKKNVGKSRLSYDELQTIVSEIEGVLNSRPLTYLYSNELEEPLTPSQLVIGKRLLNMPEYTSEEEDFSNETPNDARKREQYLSKVMAHYWRRWKREYLVDLREYQRMQWRTRHRPEISKGDVVTIENEHNRNRLLWKLGKVEELIKGRDNVIRGARVRLANGNFIDRPLQKLFPLELHRGADENETEDSHQVPSQEKPRRKAAELARERIELIDKLEEEIDAETT